MLCAIEVAQREWYTTDMDDSFEDTSSAHTPGLHWRTPTHMHIARSVDWYWSLGIMSLIGITLSIWLDDALFAIIIALATVTVGIISAREPREHDIYLHEEGITIDHDTYPFSMINSFWVESESAVMPKLYLSTSSLMHPHLVVLLPSAEYADEAREFLELYTTEEVKHSAGTLLVNLLGW